MTITSTDARTGESRGATYDETSSDDVARTCRTAAAAAPGWAATSRADRAAALEAMAAALEDRAADVIATADAETALGQPRLTGELARTCFQLRFFADVLTEGSYLEATVDHADSSPMGPRPDLRRMLVPVGAGGGVRGEQLPAGLLRPRGRHCLRPGRGLPGGRQGPRGAPGHLGALLRPAGRGTGGRRRSGGHAVPRSRPPGRGRPGRPTRTSGRSASPARPPADAPWPTWPPRGRSRSRSTASSAASTPSW